MHTLFHVFGSGDAIDPSNHIARARLNYLLVDANVVLYGCQQPGMARSEAMLARDYLFGPCMSEAKIDLVETPKSTSESLAIVAGYLHDSYIESSHIWVEVSPEVFTHHVVVTNWPYVWRTRYLLRKQWQRLHPEVPWATVSIMITVQGVGGTFTPKIEEIGLYAIPWWLWKVGVREILAWGKALVDPYDERLNQKRGAAKVF